MDLLMRSFSGAVVAFLLFAAATIYGSASHRKATEFQSTSASGKSMTNDVADQQCSQKPLSTLVSSATHLALCDPLENTSLMQSTLAKKIIIVGGHGRIGIRLTRILAPNHTVKCIIRSRGQSDDIKRLSAEPIVLSVEEAPVSSFSKVFEGQDIVYYTAGVWGWGGFERSKKVDFEGAVKVFDAIEGVKGDKPRLILISGMDIRNPEKVPAHYSEDDAMTSMFAWRMMGAFMYCKYLADKELITRTAFKWTILRPGVLSNARGRGKASIGRAPLGLSISRDDVAQALAALADREDSAGLAIDFTEGDTPIKEGLDAVIKKRQTDFFG